MKLTYRELGSGPQALVFLHGIGGGAASWEPQLEHFSRRYRTVAWDMPGYGESEPLPEMDFAALADALLDLLDLLKLHAPWLIGHSIGGMVAQEFVARYPARVSALVLSATSPAFGPADGAWQQHFIKARLEPLERGMVMGELAPRLVAELVGSRPDPGGVERAVACMATVPEASYRAALHCLVTFDRREDLGRIGVPALLIAGAEDGNAPASMMARMAGRIPGAQYVCLEGAGHLANLEQPQAFNAALERFLENLPGAGPGVLP